MKDDKPSATRRRRPQQSRAQHTARALREAFVHLLVEKEYEKITIREITWLAGTAVGSFYDYFESKDDLARVSLHMRSKSLLLAVRRAAPASSTRPLQQVLAAIVSALMQAHRSDPEQWAAHYLLERHMTDLAAYRKMYRRFVDAWAQAITAAQDWPSHRPVQQAAQDCHTVVYGLLAYAHLRSDQPPDYPALERQLHTAAWGYLEKFMAAPA